MVKSHFHSKHEKQNAKIESKKKFFFLLFADPFDYEVVAVVSNDAQINSVHDLRGSKLCHPGHGMKASWTDIVSNVCHFNYILFIICCRE